MHPAYRRRIGEVINEVLMRVVRVQKPLDLLRQKVFRRAQIIQVVCPDIIMRRFLALIHTQGRTPYLVDILKLAFGQSRTQQKPFRVDRPEAYALKGWPDDKPCEL